MFRLDPKQTILEHATQGAAQSSADAALSSAAEKVADQPVEATYSASVIVGLTQLVETLFLVALGMGLYWSYVGGGVDGFYVPAIAGTAILANILFNAGQCHSVRAYRTLVLQTARALAAWSVAFVILTVTIFALKAHDQVSRVWTISWYATGAISIVMFRLALRSLVRHWSAEGRLTRRAVIVGGGEDAAALVEAIRNSPNSDIELLGLFDDRVDARSPDNVAGCPKLGTVPALPEFARRTKLDLVIVSMPLSAEKRVLEMLKQLWVLPVDIRLSAHMSKLKFTEKAYSYVGDVPVFDMADRPISDWNLVFKWLFDKVVALAALILLVAGDDRRRHRHQARQQGAGAVPAEAPRLQQRTDRDLQVPVHVCRSGRPDGSKAGEPGMIRGSPASAGSSARPRSMSCRSFSTCSRASSRSSGRGRMPCTPRPRTRSITKRWTAISPAIASSRA